jgi:hypothetical protein
VTFLLDIELSYSLYRLLHSLTILIKLSFPFYKLFQALLLIIKLSLLLIKPSPY